MAKYKVGDTARYTYIAFDGDFITERFTVIRVFPEDDAFNSMIAHGTEFEGQQSYRVKFEDGHKGILYESEFEV